MAFPNEVQHLIKTFSEGRGVDEKLLLIILAKWEPEKRQTFRKGCPDLFIKYECQFGHWLDDNIKRLEQEFLRFKNAIVSWTMHPWERDARLAKKAMKDNRQSYLLVEIACTRSSEELLGARRAYHCLFDHSIEEDAAYCIEGNERKLLVALVSAYRYDGKVINCEAAESDAKALNNAIKNVDKKSLIEDDEVVRVLTTRSKPHLKEVYEQYKKIFGKNLDKDLDTDLRLKETVQCLCTPHKYFIKVLDASLKNDVDMKIKKALTRIIVTRANTDIKQIRDEFQNIYGVALTQKIEEIANGNYKDFLLTLIANGN
ncbi:Annexin [Parasponia andersonii]|uniref:Annexin n=1 Tax=Parasponia andersonii TaxID=3476 RepID=A0A2P5BL67_PARAD|nr:Annexin [Parasponia andersonii]